MNELRNLHWVPQRFPLARFPKDHTKDLYKGVSERKLLDLAQIVGPREQSTFFTKQLTLLPVNSGSG